VDCAQAYIDYKEERELTHAEKLKAMEQSFFRALNKFEICQITEATNSSHSTASSGMLASEGLVKENKADNVNTYDLEGSSGANGQIGALTNGKVPDDIPSADNDSILEAQIRNAAMNESDETIRKKLWNEYRKYKGME